MFGRSVQSLTSFQLSCFALRLSGLRCTIVGSMRVGICLIVCIATTFGCGNKSKDKDKPTPPPTATTGAATPKAVMEGLKKSVAKGDLKQALTFVRVHEHAIFVGLAYLDVAMPVVLKLSGGDKLTPKYEAINRKHNLVIDERELMRVAQTRKFAELNRYFTNAFKGNDMHALWQDVHAAVPKDRVIWPKVDIHRVTKYGENKAKVEMSIKGVDSSARFDVIKQNGRWYFDVGAFGKNQEPPKGVGLNPPPEKKPAPKPMPKPDPHDHKKGDSHGHDKPKAPTKKPGSATKKPDPPAKK